ncbi:MAG: threonine ammonia-lyase, biosynthetic [Gammaproteobacteria bacterium]|nr:MAG: threonine ammonia-lyase, biosynthetic [Gammaproteobacteria bacterium]
MDPYLQRILTARVYEVAVETPLEPAPRLSARVGNRVLFKREDLQPVFSFKIRGAYNKLRQLSEAELRRGVICSSAGNHAQGVALAARELGARAVVVMPVTTPRIKVGAVADFGAEVVLHGHGYDDAQAHALGLAQAQGLVFIHPFDDPEVIAGQGTIGMEIHRQHRGPPDAIFVPIGGGGLIAGIASYIKALFPETRIIGVEPEDAPSMHAALQAGEPVTLGHVGIFADGVAVRRVGDETFRLCQALVDEIVLVSTDETCAAIQDIFEDTRTVVEPAGALAVAGLKKWVAASGWRDRSFVTLNCGANVNFDRLRHIAERAALGEQREALLAVEIPERQGSFLAFCEQLGERNITEFNYRYANSERAHIFVGVELSDGATERGRVIEALESVDYPVVDLSDNELAKLHIRHLVGGLAPGLRDERLYRFEFPERPGALLKFLQAIGSRWNISLFHYRNHGSDYGRVLAGIQVPDAEVPEFRRHLAELAYPCWDESDNPAYRMFLAAPER